jgi:hypothetical protein
MSTHRQSLLAVSVDWQQVRADLPAILLVVGGLIVVVASTIVAVSLYRNRRRK